MDEAEWKKRHVPIVREALSRLGVHFESVQVFCSSYDPTHKSTNSISMGLGNYFARLGQVHTWSAEVDEFTRESIRDDKDGDDLDTPEDDDLSE